MKCGMLRLGQATSTSNVVPLATILMGGAFHVSQLGNGEERVKRPRTYFPRLSMH